MMIDQDKLKRAISNMEGVNERLVLKLASSTTGAQAHIGLITQCHSDLTTLKGMLSDEKVMTTPKSKSYSNKEG